MSGTSKYLGLAIFGSLVGSSVMSACGANSGSGAGGIGASAGASAASGFGGGAATAGGGGSGAGIVVNEGGDAPVNPDAACSKFETKAEIVIKPVDVIFIVDNSCSMSAEAAAIEANINVNFANIIQSSGLDYRVIMIAEQGPTSDESLCIGPPLGAVNNCPALANTAPVNNPPIFFHFDNDDVESTDGWCKALTWYNQPDRYNLAPGGWKDWLRPEAFKTFVMVTDDHVACNNVAPWYCFTGCTYSDTGGNETATALKFDTDLTTKDSTQFGSPAKRNYIWHSIIGVAPNPSNPTKAYLPTDPITTSTCTGAVNASPGNQALSILTGGLRFPVCEGQGFDVVFQEIAKGVIQGAKVACEFDVPEAPEGKQIDLASITVDYSPLGDENQKQHFDQVANVGACKPGSFFIEDNKIKLCPDTCKVVQEDDKAKVDIVVACLKEKPT